MAQAKYGTGTVFKTKDGRYKWQGYYIDETGKRHRPTKTFNTERDALKYQAEQYEKAEVKRARKSSEMTVQAVYDMWVSEVSSKRIKQSETTLKNTIQNYNKHILPLIKNDNINNINILKLQRYFNQLKAEGKSDKTIYNIYTDLKKIIKFSINKKILFDNPLDELQIVKPQQKKEVVNVLYIDEYNKLLNNEKNKTYYYYPLIHFMCETGLRISELAIKNEDIKEVELEKDVLKFAVIKRSIKRILKDAENSRETELQIIEELKNENSWRNVPLNIDAQFCIYLQEKQKEELNISSPFIFCNKKGGLLDQRNILRDLHKMFENCGLQKKGLHSLRKFYINNTLKNGVQPFDLAKITGHSMQTMFKYYHNVDYSILKLIADASEKK